MIRSEKLRRIRFSIVLVCAIILIIYCLETREPQCECQYTAEVLNASTQTQMEKNQTLMEESSNSYSTIVERQRQFSKAKILNAVKELENSLNASAKLTDDRQHQSQLATAKILNAISQMEEALISPPTMLLEPTASRRCQKSGSGLFLLAMVMSAPGNSEQRRVIRYAWAEMRSQWEAEFLREHQNQSGVTEVFRLLFYVGQPKGDVWNDTQKEWNEHGDMVVDNFHYESSLTLTLMTLRMLRWVTSNCSGAQYVIKLHDDVFVHIPKLFRNLSFPISQGQSLKQPRVVLGNVIRDSVVYREHFSEFFVPEILYPWEHYPAYLSDFCYVLGMGAAKEIIDLVEESRPNLKLFHIEDVFVIGIVANERLGIPLQQIAPILSNVDFVVETNQSFTLEPGKDEKRKPVQWLLQHVIIHPVTSDKMKCLTKFTGPGNRSLTEGC